MMDRYLDYRERMDLLFGELEQLYGSLMELYLEFYEDTDLSEEMQNSLERELVRKQIEVISNGTGEGPDAILEQMGEVLEEMRTAYNRKDPLEDFVA